MFRILVAEDDDSARFLMCEVLRRAGYEPCPARDGVEALEVMEHYQCDLAVVDITMPRMDGVAFTQTLREGNCDLPVLMVTARVTQEDKRRGFRAGCDDYMVKPVDEEEMLWRIEALLRRALALLDKARLLLPQNTDPKISETILYAETAQTLLSLGEADKAVSLWKTHNTGGFYSHIIGSTLSSSCDRPQEALPFLSDALLNACADLVNIVVGYLNVYYKQRDFAAAQAVTQWGLATLGGLRDGDKPCFLDKINASLLACLAAAQKNCGETDAARVSLRQAQALAAQFDAAPDYRGDALRFVSGGEPAGIYDDLGATAMDGVRKIVRDLDDAELLTWWKELDRDAAE